VVALAAALGIAVGLLAGYQGGALDAVLMCLVNLQLAVPPLLFFIAASVVVGHTMGALIILLALFSWVPYARLVRTKVMLERQSDYVSGARLAGSSRLRILLVHLLPGCAGLIVTFASVQAGLVLLWESGLSFLGVGLQPPDVSLGFLIQQGRADMLGAPWVAVCPGLAIVLLVVAFNVIGNGLRDAFHIDAKL
jgi:peptide/nickel transport system permease protein